MAGKLQVFSIWFFDDNVLMIYIECKTLIETKDDKYSWGSFGGCFHTRLLLAPSFNAVPVIFISNGAYRTNTTKYDAVHSGNLTWMVFQIVSEWSISILSFLIVRSIASSCFLIKKPILTFCNRNCGEKNCVLTTFFLWWVT